VSINVVGSIKDVEVVGGTVVQRVSVVSGEGFVLSGTGFVVGVDGSAGGDGGPFGAGLGEAMDVFVSGCGGTVSRGLFVKPMGFLGTLRFRRNLGRTLRGSGPLG
jgi:hypothetical protein